ncbi:phosphotransferase [Amycolatopsis sp. lyj-109]|uniref:phosphotransferase n=1 Tax=Amycolatopsis sp. lyj-109 TaxID=2789287 RepID=UPI00397A5711
MARSTWDELPAGVRAAIERKAGPVAAAEVPSAGRNSDFSATLHTADGPVFCKGIADAEGKRGQMHRHEADINPWLPSAVAPRLRWRTEADGWLLLGFDHVHGHHAGLSPGSPDLPVVAATVNTLVDALSECSAEAPRLAEQWSRLAAWQRLAKAPEAPLDTWTLTHLDQLVQWEARAIDMADGDSLVHTDLHSLNMLVNSDRALAIDWAWSRKGRAAIDVAFLVARLVAAGHTAANAERWANALPIWQDTLPETRIAFAIAIWGIWTYQSNQQPRPLWDQLVPAARAWSHHCLAQTPQGRIFQ